MSNAADKILATRPTEEEVRKMVGLAIEHVGYPDAMSHEGILDMASHYSDDEQFILAHEDKIVEISKSIPDVVTKHFHEKWSR